jgi:hypothetical protein
MCPAKLPAAWPSRARASSARFRGAERRGGHRRAATKERAPDDRSRPPTHRARGRGLPDVPAARRLARRGGGGEAGRLPRRGVLVAWRTRVRRPQGERARARSRAGRARREPHRTDVHRRPLRRLVVPGDAPGGLRQPAHVGEPGRRPAPHGRLGHLGRQVRAAGQPPAAGRARRLPAVPAARARRTPLVACRRVPRHVRLRGGLRRVRRAAPAAVRSRGRGARGPGDAPVLVPPEPAEHVHRPPDRADARRGVRAGPRARRRGGPSPADLRRARRGARCLRARRRSPRRRCRACRRTRGSARRSGRWWWGRRRRSAATRTPHPRPAVGRTRR